MNDKSFEGEIDVVTFYEDRGITQQHMCDESGDVNLGGGTWMCSNARFFGVGTAERSANYYIFTSRVIELKLPSICEKAQRRGFIFPPVPGLNRGGDRGHVR